MKNIRIILWLFKNQFKNGLFDLQIKREKEQQAQG